MPLLQDSAQVVIRIGGTRLGGEELCKGLLDSLNSTDRKFRLMESRQTVVKNGQRRIFQERGTEAQHAIKELLQVKLTVKAIRCSLVTTVVSGTT